MSVYALSISCLSAARIDAMFGPEFNMAHELSITVQHTVRVGNLSAPEEPDIDVSCEHIDVAECRIIYTRSRMTVRQQLSNVVSAGAHDVKPALCDYSKLTGTFVHPNLDRWISLNRIWEPHKLAHGN
jgi:hypothetical protein